MNGKEIHVIVENIITDNTDASTQPTNKITSPNEPTNAKKSGGLGKAVMINAVNQATQFALSNYGNLTGDYVTQANIQGGLEMIGLGVMAMSGPVGAVAALGTLAIKEANRQIEITKKNQATNLLRQRTGMTSYSGGRR